MSFIPAHRVLVAVVTVVAVVVLTVALPVGWYLGSPIILRSTLVEPPPVAPVVATAATSGTQHSPAPSVVARTTPTAPPTASPFAVRPVATGEFRGTDEFHFGRGTATIVEVETGRYHLRLDDFSVRNGPDLYVYLSPSADGWTPSALELGRLKATDGAFGYDLPAGADPSVFRSAIIWCRQFSHLFATAPFRA